eukprot:2747297-Lingulodinium_polyedra.AAC.1
MGDSWAVEIAQHAHQGLLEGAGLRGPDCVVRPGCALPSGSYLDILQIDDHIGIELTPPGCGPSRAPAIFGRAELAYERARLKKNDTKAVRGASEAV